VVDNGAPVELQPLYNGFLWRGRANKPANSYYYAILSGDGTVVTSENNMKLEPTIAGQENLSFERAPPDDGATTTLNEIFGAKYTVGDEIIQGIPRIEKKRPAYDKFSLLYQEGQIPNIRAQCSDDKYNTLVTSGHENQELTLQNCTMTYIS